MNFLGKVALYIFVCVCVCANLLYIFRDANKYFNISSWLLVSSIFFFFEQVIFSYLDKAVSLTSLLEN